MRTRRTITATAFVALVMLVFCGTAALAGASERDKARGIQKTATTGLYRPFLINNIFNYYSNNGDGSLNKFKSDAEGFEFPKGANTTCLYEDGIVWGGFTKGIAHPMVGGSTYNHGLQAGKILTPGGPEVTQSAVAEDPGLAKNRIFRVRPDIGPRTPLDDAMKKKISDEEVTYISRFEHYSVDDIYGQYVADWNEWPAADGAPYADVNHNGVYDPSVDIPGVPGADQTLWYVSNDADDATAKQLAGCNGIGLEMQRTIWGYKRQGPLGNVIFASTKLINKSGASVDSMYLVEWSDPDLGTASDDFAGCDTSRSLGYVYNGGSIDGEFGKRVPAVGFTFFQGPIVAGAPTDSAIFELKYRHGFKNLKMSAFNFFINQNSTFADPDLAALSGATQWYNLMKGLVGGSGAAYLDNKGAETKFCLAGDPVTGTGWLDGTIAPPGDRRIVLVTGPFTFANGDTQEVVVASLVGQGKDKIRSVPVLRFISDQAQAAYNLLFNLPVPPPQPSVSVRQLDKEILLTWADTVKAGVIENWTTTVGHKFQGYNVYQLPASSFDPTTAVLLATYDIKDGITLVNDYAYDEAAGTILFKPVQFGGDNGLARYYDAVTDAVNSTPLVNGTNYYFAVTAYTYSTDPLARPNNLESAPVVFTVTPQSPLPGSQVSSTGNTKLNIQHPTGISSAAPTINVVDPTQVVPHDYEIRVAVTDSVPVLQPDSTFVMQPNPKWQVWDVTANSGVGKPSTLYAALDKSAPILQGFQAALNGAPFYIPGKELGSLTYSGAWNVTEVDGGGISKGKGIFVADGLINSALTADQVSSDVQMVIDPANGQNAYCFVRGAPGAGSGSGGALYVGSFPQPFRVYELNADGTHRRQIDFAFMENNGSAFQNHIWSPGESAGDDREYAYFIAETYSPTEKAKYVANTSLLSATLAQDSVVWAAWFTLTDPASPAYTNGATWTIKATKPVKPVDKWTFSLKSVAPIAGSSDLAKADVNRINVFPNPYFGFNSQEPSKYNRFVTFSHLPKKAVVRVFNLAGVLVRTLQKDDANTQFLQWDLNNAAGFPVAAGMYIAYIEMPDIGSVKTLKFAIIPETQYIDRY